MSKRRFLYFDLGKVLVDFDHDLMCQQLADIAGAEFAMVKELVMGEGNLMGPMDVGAMSQKEFYERFCEATESKPSLESVLYATGAIFSLKTEMIPVVTQLVAGKQPIGILSNTCQPHWDYVCNRYAPIPDLFDVVVLSYEVGAAKPDRAIYDAAAEMAGYDPAEILFVDDRADNVAGAIAAGFEAVQFTTAHQFLADLRKYDFRLNL